MSWGLFTNSLLLGCSVTFGAIVTGLVVALWARTSSVAVHRAVRLLAVAALMLPPFLVVNAWLDLLAFGDFVVAGLPRGPMAMACATGILTLLFLAGSFSARGWSVGHDRSGSAGG